MLHVGSHATHTHSSSIGHVPEISMASNVDDSLPSGAATPRSPCDQSTNPSVKVRMVRAVRKCRRDSEPCSAWLLLFFVLLPMNIVYGMEYTSYSLYYVAYAQYFPDETRYTIGVTVAIKETFASLFGIITSVLVDRYGSPAVVSAAGFLVSCGFVLSSLAPNLYMLYITQGMLVGIAMNLLLLSVHSTLQWTFSVNRGLASGLACIGYTIGNIVGIPLIDSLLDNYGWRGCVLLQGGISANIIALSMLMPNISRNRTQHNSKDSDEPADQGSIASPPTTSLQASGRGSHLMSFLREVFDFSLLKDICLLLYCCGTMMNRYNTITYWQHLPSRAVSLGLTRSDGATFMSACATSILTTRVLVTFISNIHCVNRVLMFSAGCFTGAIGSFVIALFDTYAGQMTGSVIMGVCIASTNTLMYTVLVDLMGVEKFNKSMALLELTVGIAALVSAPLGGLIYDLSGNYDATFLSSASCSVCGGLLVLTSALVDIKRRKQQQQTETI